MTLELPLPCLSEGRFDSLAVQTDDDLFYATGVRIAFTGRRGGVSQGSYESLNLSDQVGDEDVRVLENRRRVLSAFGVLESSCIIPRQIHGEKILIVGSGAPQSLLDMQNRSQEGFDAVLVNVAHVATLMCFADCVPIIIVSPSGSFVVVHAGWRGVLNEVAAKAIECLKFNDEQKGHASSRTSFNVYIGPHICEACFGVGNEVRAQFAEHFGSKCFTQSHHINLGMALATTLKKAGIDLKRVTQTPLCTVCYNNEYFSYRAQNGVCGRHGAFAVRKERS